MLDGLPALSQECLSLVSRFEESLADRAGATAIADYLALAEEAHRPALFLHLLCAHLCTRQRQGEAPTPEEYRGRFPEFADQVDLAFALVRQLPPSEGEPSGHRPPGPAVLPKIGGYELLGKVGHGGMGVVYRARDLRLGRVVALKMILSGAHASPTQLARFRVEAEAVARLQHPNIVQVFEVGECEGNKYLALEYAAGGRLQTRPHGELRPAAASAEIVRTLATALQYAHDHGIIHRDLKPANVLMGEDSIPKVADFGLARLSDGSMQTGTGAVLGTPSYMAPEQAASKAEDIGPATDVYGLGAILYELLTGQPPFRAATAFDTIKQVREQEPVPPRALHSKVPADLETICLKCLHKEPIRRYSSAEALAEDLRCFLEGRVIAARPAGNTERFWRWCRRHPALAASTTLTMVSLVAGIIVSTLFAFQASEQAEAFREQKHKADQAARYAESQAEIARQMAESALLSAAKEKTANNIAQQNEKTAYRHLYTSQLNLAPRAWERNNVRQLIDILEKQKPEHTGNIDFRGFEWYYWKWRSQAELLTIQVPGPTGSKNPAVFSHNGEWVASASLGTVRGWEAASGRILRTLPRQRATVEWLAFSPDDSGLYVAVSNGFAPDQQMEICGWRWATGHKWLGINVQGGFNGCYAISPDGRRLATVPQDTSRLASRVVQVWDTHTGECLVRLTNVGASHLSFLPDGNQLLAARNNPAEVRIWDIRESKQLEALPPVFSFSAQPLRSIAVLALSPDGQYLAASSSSDPKIVIWDLRRQPGAKEPRAWVTITMPKGDVRSLAFSPNSKRLLSGGIDTAVHVWEVTTGRELFSLKGHDSIVWSVAFSAKGERLLSASADGTVKIWNAGQDRQPLKMLLGRYVGRIALAIHPNGQQVAIAAIDPLHEVQVRGVSDGKLVRTFKLSWVRALAYSPDGRFLFMAGCPFYTAKRFEVGIHVWDAQTDQLHSESHQHPCGVGCLSFSPSAQFLAWAGGDGKVTLWDLCHHRLARILEGHTPGRAVNGMAFDRDETRLVSGGDDKTMRLWDTATGKHLATYSAAENRGVSAVAFSPDGRYLASGGSDKLVKIWDANPDRPGASTSPLYTLRGHTWVVKDLAYSPDGKRLVSIGPEVKLWNTATGDELLHLDESGLVAAFSPDGERLAIGDSAHGITIFAAPRAGQK